MISNGTREARAMVKRREGQNRERMQSQGTEAQNTDLLGAADNTRGGEGRGDPVPGLSGRCEQPQRGRRSLAEALLRSTSSLEDTGQFATGILDPQLPLFLVNVFAT